MKEKIKTNGKHLTYSDRVYIEQELVQGSSFKSIAEHLKKDPSTISKEVRSHLFVPSNGRSKYPRCYYCSYLKKCNDTITQCCGCNKDSCWNCSTGRSDATGCSDYNPFKCPKLSKPPYVCNGCSTQQGCEEIKRFYRAKQAQKEYEKTLTDSRSGINMTPSELKELNELISPLILKGQPLSHIFAVHDDEIPVCRRTLYNYLDQQVFQARNIDLPRRVRYKRRKKQTTSKKRATDQTYRNRRTYKDFERFMEAHPEYEVVEMDTVKGSVNSGKCLLTLLFRKSNFMLAILLPKCTQECVINAINTLTDNISLKLFKKFFPVILTDNGPEFKNPYDIEKTEDGKHRTYVFYCDPYVSNQKAKLEKNHEFIRYVIPKGRSMYKYTQEDINLMTSHINSLARDSINGACPFDLAEILLDKRIPALTGLKRISPDDVMLKPELIEKNN